MRRSKNNRRGFSTRSIHAGQAPDPTTGAIMTPIYATSTYVQESPGVHKGYEYARTQNPKRMAFERCIADLEGGSAAFAFASGLAAISTTLECLDHGSHVIAVDDLYGGTRRLFHRVRNRSMGLEVSQLDLTDAVLVASELAENLIQHTRSEGRLRLDLLGAVPTLAVADAAERQARGAPKTELRAGRADDPAPDLGYDRACRQRVDERSRRKDAAFRMPPTDERFGADHPNVTVTALGGASAGRRFSPAAPTTSSRPIFPILAASYPMAACRSTSCWCRSLARTKRGGTMPGSASSICTRRSAGRGW